MKDKIYFECCNRFKSVKNISNNIFKLIFDNPKYSILYTLNQHWKNIIDLNYYKYTEIEKIFFIQNTKKINLYIISYNSSISFFINNNKLYIIDKINALFGCNLVNQLFVKEIPKSIIKVQSNHLKNINKEKLNNYTVNINNVNNKKLKVKLDELAKLVLVK